MYLLIEDTICYLEKKSYVEADLKAIDFMR